MLAKTLISRRLCAGAALAAMALFSRSMAAQEPLTRNESQRPQIHFTPTRHWMNDPNGLVYVDGDYHLFFQYNPKGNTWGHMSWGHAVSKDLLHWKERPVAIPEDNHYMIFSGSVVVDTHNSSGFARDGKPVLVAVYTGAQPGENGRQNQQVAYSNDKGRSWTKYAGNPVLDLGLTSFRDPKVFWYEPVHAWIMVAVLADRHQVTFFSSPDLKSWTHLSDFGPAGAKDGAWECPDLFVLPIDGDQSMIKWVLKVDVFRSAIARGAGAQYFTGGFDGRSFIADTDAAAPTAGPRARWIDYGMDFYAAASWANLPDPTRHVWIAWMSNHGYAQQAPTYPWRGTMSIPRELALHSDGDTPRLVQQPVRELATLRTWHEKVVSRELGSDPYQLNSASLGDGAIELIAEMAAGSSREFGVRVHVGHGQETRIGYDSASQQLFVDRASSGQILTRQFAERQMAPLKLRNGKIRLHVIVDSSSVEIFANDGELVITEQIFPGPHSEGIQFYADGGRARLEQMDLWLLKSTRVRAELLAGDMH